jgi:hypothetical protein
MEGLRNLSQIEIVKAKLFPMNIRIVMRFFQHSPWVILRFYKA